MKQTKQLIAECEQRYNGELLRVAKEIVESKKIFVMITGASCAGKTTTTKMLKQFLAEYGVHAETVSLDDFYLNTDRIPRDKDGNPDFETIYSLDLELLDKVMCGIAGGEKVKIPRFDFTKKSRSDEFEELSLDKDEVVIIEGLHALNPLLFRHVDKGLVYRIYLQAESEKYDVKLLRRIVRDEYFRKFGAESTLEMWGKVLEGEQKYIKPYADTADATVKTFFEYETRLLAPEGVNILSKVDKSLPTYPLAADILKAIEGLEPISYDLVPDSSLMHEFIKKN